jgi:ElaB/YqjD/DUF883 family membrane-anchored ribosome-binding protein
MSDKNFSNTATASPEAAANELRAAASEFAKSTSQQAANVKDCAIDAANALKASAVQKAEHFKSVATEKASHVRDVAQQQWDETRVRAKEIHVTTEDYIRQNPTKAVLGALGVGFLIGLIVRR